MVCRANHTAQEDVKKMIFSGDKINNFNNFVEVVKN